METKEKDARLAATVSLISIRESVQKAIDNLATGQRINNVVASTFHSIEANALEARAAMVRIMETQPAGYVDERL